jgi:hypothetical protein
MATVRYQQAAHVVWADEAARDGCRTSAHCRGSGEEVVGTGCDRDVHKGTDGEAKLEGSKVCMCESEREREVCEMREDGVWDQLRMIAEAKARSVDSRPQWHADPGSVRPDTHTAQD